MTRDRQVTSFISYSEKLLGTSLCLAIKSEESKMNFDTLINGDVEEDFERKSTSGLGLLQDDKLFVEWLTFLYGIWENIEYI